MEEGEKKNNKVFLIGLLLIALVVGFSLFRSGFKKNNEAENSTSNEKVGYPEISAEDLQKKIKSGEVQILDIRSSEDYQLEHILSSTSVTSEDLSANISPEKTTIIVGYPEDINSIYQEYKLLKSKGFKDVFALSGGISSWKNLGSGTISAGNPGSFVDQSKVTYITPEDLKKVLENKTYPSYVLDIRAKQLFDSGHISGAANISLGDLEKSKNKIPFGKEIFVYGDTDTPGFQAGVRLYDLGFLAVRVLRGGLNDWRAKGFELVK